MHQQELTVEQFGSNAESYLVSEVHSQGADLAQLTGLSQQMGIRRVLDLGCGAGHASYALARGGANHVVAYDPSAEMLDVVAREAQRRGHATIETKAGSAEMLPFASGYFELVVTRYSAHHWANVPRALAECARVLGAAGRLIVIDVVAPEEPVLDTALQVIEFLRDASHVRNYRITEWRAMHHAAGFGDVALKSWKTSIDFPTWIARIGTPPDRIAGLQAVFDALPTEVTDYFRVSHEHSFQLDTAWIESHACAAVDGGQLSQDSATI